MHFILSLRKYLFLYFDVAYFRRFILLLLVFYFTNLLLISLTRPNGRFYSPFLTENFHYVNWMRSSILHTSNVIDRALGLNSYVKNTKTLKVFNGRSVLMARQCLGLEIMGFWIAFILAHDTRWRKKLYWCLAGIAAIWFINCWRVALVLLALEKNWKVIKNVDHHDMFNLVAYSLIAIMMYAYYRHNENEKEKVILAV